MDVLDCVYLWLAALCLQPRAAWSLARHDMNSVTEALEYVQEIASQDEGNCSFGPTLDLEYDKERWTEEAAVAVRAANLLTSLSRTGSHIFGSGDEDEQLLYALVMGNVDNNLNVFGSAIAFDYLLYRDYEIFSPYAYRAADGTEVKDLSIGYDYLTNSTDWFYIPFLNFQNTSLDSNSPHHQSPSPVTSSVLARLGQDDGYWTKPYYDCGGGNVWMVTFSMPFFLPIQSLSANASTDTSQSEILAFAGVTTIDVALSSLDINQCDQNATEDSQNVFDPFIDTHLCKDTTYCRPISGRGFQRGAYLCVCLKGYYFPDTTAGYQAFNGSEIEDEYSKKVHGYPNVYDSNFTCLQCKKGCDECTDDSTCFLEPSDLLRYISLGLTGLCILVVISLAIYTFVKRNNKVFKAASPVLLFVFLAGSTIMYGEVVLHAVLVGDMAPLHCVLQPWARYLGVALSYGALLFKTWRITVVFKVRSAKPVRITDANLCLRIAGLVVLMCAFLGVGTFAQPSKVVIRQTSGGLKYEECTSTVWSFIGEAVTLLLLAWGVYLCVKVRKAPSAFNESKFISICIYNEALMSAFSIILSIAILPSVESTLADKQLIVAVCRVHLTVTVMVALLFGSKIYHVIHTEAEQSGTQLELKKRQGAGGPRPISRATVLTLDSISPSIDFNYTNPDIKDEIQRMSRVLESIQENLTLHDKNKFQTRISDLHSRLRNAAAEPGQDPRPGQPDESAAGSLASPGAGKLEKDVVAAEDIPSTSAGL